MRIPFLPHWLSHRTLRSQTLGALLYSEERLHVKANKQATEIASLTNSIKQLSADVAELAKVSRRRELVVVAAHHFAEVFSNTGLAHDEGAHLNDKQMHALTELMRVTGYGKAADIWQSYHIPDDEDQDPFERNEDQALVTV